MRANERLKNVIKVGYLETPSSTSKVRPELNPIHMDNTDYEVNDYKREQRDASEKRRMKELFKEFAQEHKKDNVAGFWESYLHGFGLIFKFMGKGAIFLIGFFVTYWIWNMIF